MRQNKKMKKYKIM